VFGLQIRHNVGVFLLVHYSRSNLVVCFLQIFSYTKKKALQTDDLCLDVSSMGGPVKLFQCHGLGGNQKWEYSRQVPLPARHPAPFARQQAIISPPYPSLCVVIIAFYTVCICVYHSQSPLYALLCAVIAMADKCQYNTRKNPKYYHKNNLLVPISICFKLATH
jgi:hypothetical protein